MSLFLSILIGAGLGAVLGYYGKCASGTCPFRANPWRGAIYGVVLGILFHTALARNESGSSAGPSANVKLVNQAQFDSEVTQSSRPAAVDFFATWCGPCKKLSPLLDELAGSLTNKITFLKVDMDQSAQLATRFGIEGVPTLVFFRNGKEVDRQVGLTSKSALKARLDSLLPPAGSFAGNKNETREKGVKSKLANTVILN